MINVVILINLVNLAIFSLGFALGKSLDGFPYSSLVHWYVICNVMCTKDKALRTDRRY